MNKQDDTKLWHVLGSASQAVPGEDFARKVMRRIAEEDRTIPVQPESIHQFKQRSFRIWASSAAALIAAVVGITLLMEPAPTAGTGNISLASLDIDDVLVEEAGLALGQENLMDALCVLSSTETGVISSDSIPELIL